MSTPAGWYDDGSGRQRWWDGQQWTEHFAPAAAQPAAETASPPTAAFTVPTAAEIPPYAAAPTEIGAAGGGPVATSTKKKPSVLGYIALGVAVLGFLFACIPGALIVGWILLPIGFVLSIVAFFVKGAKWPALTGVVVAVVGTIVGVIVFLSILASAASNAFGGSESLVSPPSDEAIGEVDDEEAAAGELGTRSNPAPLGSLISGDEYDVVVNSVTLGADEQVRDANPFNEPADDGFSYAVINLTVTYTGDDSGYSMMAIVDFVADSGEVYGASDSIAVAPDPALGLEELYNGGSATGNIVLAIPADGAGVLRVSPGVFADEVFVALQ